MQPRVIIREVQPVKSVNPHWVSIVGITFSILITLTSFAYSAGSLGARITQLESSQAEIKQHNISSDQLLIKIAGTLERIDEQLRNLRERIQVVPLRKNSVLE